MRTVVITNRHPRLRLDRRALAAAIHALDAHADEILVRGPGFPDGELSLVFLTDSALAQLHARFLQDPAPTDVITFEGESAFGIAGEICISADSAARHLGRRPTGAVQRAFSAELVLYVIHGWLHLAGHDDLVPLRKRAMRRAEARAMAILGRTGHRPMFRLLP
jgi:probable rRNA maturation factor